MAETQGDPVDAVIFMIRGQWVSLSIRAAVELGVFDHLDTPRTIADLAAATGSDPATLARLVRVLADAGLLARAADTDRVSRTLLGETLAADHPSRVRDLALMQTELPPMASWQRLADAVRTGRSVFEAANGIGPWESLSANPEQEATFNDAMARRGVEQAGAIFAAADLTGVELLVDVGGGRGGMLAEVLRAVPGLHGVVADRPEVARAAQQFFADSGLADRASGVGVDFFESVPAGGDVYVMSNVLHDWDDEAAVRILTTTRAAMAPEGRLWVLERLLDAADRPFEGQRDLHLIDLHMLVMFGARERTLAEYDALLSAAGFGPGVPLSTPGAWDIVETHPRPEPVQGGPDARIQ